MRIASLLPAATEIVAALGRADDLVGVTFECDTPGQIAHHLPIMVRGLDTEGRSPGEIDAMVREFADSGDPMYRLDEAALATAKPDVILTQDLCRVCALASHEVAVALERLETIGCTARVVSLDPHRLDEVLGSIIAVGDAIGASDEARSLTDHLNDRLSAVRQHLPATVAAPRTFVLEWPDPPFLAGHWIPDLVTAAGGEAVLAAPGRRSVETTWERISATDPEVVIVAPCGFGLTEATAIAEQSAHRLPDHTAIWAIDADGYTVRPGPRLVDAVEQIERALHGTGDVDPRIMTRVR
jgi:iron complex transport system substrate-binding protein